MALGEYLQGEVAQDYADGLLSRRDALRRLGLLGLSLSGAGALLAACARDGENDERSTASTQASTSTSTSTTAAGAELIRFNGASGEIQAAWAAAATPKGAVLVIHENRGLTPHFFDVVGRLARDGYSALAVDLLSAEGGTASLDASGGATAALGAASTERLVGDLRSGLDELPTRVPGAKLGAIGFCFGGAMAWSLLQAGEARLAAVIPFYGPAPDHPDFTKAKAAVLGVYAGLDSRVNASRARAEDALKRAGLTYEIRTFKGADHAFFNDTGPRYNAQAATEAYQAVLEWFGRYLA